MTNWLDRARREISYVPRMGTAVTAEIPNLAVLAVATPDTSSFSHGDDAATRAFDLLKAIHTQHLAQSSAIAWSTIAMLIDPEALAECITDEQRRAYVRLLDDRAHVEAGVVPSHWTHRAHCAGCGDVWLWAPLRVLGCLWCRNRKNGWPIPRPTIAR